MRRAIPITLSAVLCCTLAGCDLIPGSTSAQTSSTPKPSPEFDVCQLLSEEQLVSLEVETKATPKDWAGKVGCEREGKVFSIGLFRDVRQSFDESEKGHQSPGFQWTRVDVNGRRGAHYVASAGKTECAFIFDIGATANLYIQIFNKSTDPGTPCVTAERVAKMVEPNLPKI